MPFGLTPLIVCQKALADIGTRSTITSIEPPDGSPEAHYCNLYYGGVRNQALRAANWNFCLATAALTLWKALPGTPENQSPATTNGWSPSYPAPPWTYSYMLPLNCLRARSLIGQPQQVPIQPPLFSGAQGTNPPISQRLPMARFDIAADYFDRTGQKITLTWQINSVTAATPGTGYLPGDLVTLNGGAAGMQAIVSVASISPMTLDVYAGGTYATSQIGMMLGQLSTTGSGSGLTVNVTDSTQNNLAQPVVLTNQENALLNFTVTEPPEEIWDAMFEETMVSALAARLAQSLTGDKALARDKITIANANIQSARSVDGNEGLTINDHMPDWIRVRGAGGGLGYETFFYPLGPLFPIAPLV